MHSCPHPDCGWTPIAPSAGAAREQYAAHLVADHAREVDVDLPEGTVQVTDGDGEWTTLDADAVDHRDH